MGGFTSPVDAFKHNQESAAEVVVWEGHRAEDRERMASRTGYLTLAVSHSGVAYCSTSLVLWERVGVREAKTLCRGEMCVFTHTRNSVYRAWFVCVFLVCMASTTAWSDTDKTIVDMERGLPEAASRYHRPRAAHLYQYDKTEVDLAAPLPQQPAEAQRGSQRPATLPAPMPAPTTLPPPPPPPPGGIR